MRKVITILLAAAIAISAAAFTACKSDKTEPSTAPTTAATQPVTQPVTQPATKAAGSSQTSSNSGGSAENITDNASVEENGDPLGVGLTYEEAKEDMYKLALPGGTITSAYQGYTEDGIPAWIINVVNSDGTPETFYLGKYFGYSTGGASTDHSNGPVDGDTSDSRDFVITCDNSATGESYSVLCSYADDHYDTVSGYFYLPSGTYNVTVYTADDGTFCGSGYIDNTTEDGNASAVRVNFYPVTGTVETE